MTNLIKFKPTSSSRRGLILVNRKKELFKPKGEKYPRKLFSPLINPAGRNFQGKITVRHKLGGKINYRNIDFKRCKNDWIPGIIRTIEHDPSRGCFISLVSYKNGDKSFIITPDKIKPGDEIISGNDNTVPINIGNCLPLSFIPSGTFVHNLEMKPGKGGQLARSAGTRIEVINNNADEKYAIVKLNSKERRKILKNCRATIGSVSNPGKNLENLAKAGRSFWRGIRPAVRGLAMNPIDHPHGGGEGKSGIGRKSPMSYRGKKVGLKTRRKKKKSDSLIILTRHKAKR